MALFENEEIVDITAPDGRALRVPKSVMQALRISQPSVSPALPAPAALPVPATTVMPVEPPVESVTDGALPTEDDQIVPAQEPAPPTEYTITIDAPTPQEVAKRNKEIEKQQRAAAAQAASPQGRVDAASAAETGALGDEAKAQDNLALIDQAGLDMQANILKTRNTQIAELEKKRVADAQAQMQAEEKAAADLGAMRKKIAGTKIDRQSDHPILNAISIALFEMGSAMKGEKFGRGLEILNNAIDRKVAAQMADLDQMGKVYGLQKDDLARLKEKGARKLELNNIMVAAESDKAIRQVEELTARIGSEKAKANGQVIIAGLKQRAAEKSMTALKWSLDYDQREQAEKNQNRRFFAGLNQAEQHHQDDLQDRREQRTLDMQKALAAERARGNEIAYKAKLEQIERNSTRGLGNIKAGGTPIYNQKGVEMLKEADALVARAKQVREAAGATFDPQANVYKFDGKAPASEMAEANARALEEKAAILRGNAEIYGQFNARSPEEAITFGKKYGAAQSAITLVDEIIGLYDAKGGKSYVQTDEGRAAIQTKMSQLQVALKDAWQAGAWDKGLATLMNNTTGGDPTKGADVQNVLNLLSGGLAGTDPDAFKGRLNSIADGLATDVTNQLLTVPGQLPKDADLFGRREKAVDTPTKQAARKLQQGRTPVEVAEGLRSGGTGVTGWIADRMRFVSREDRARQAEESGGSLTRPGLSAGQGKVFDQALKLHQSGDTTAGAALVEVAVDNSRPELGIATMHALRDNSPELYQQARDRLSPESPIGKQMDFEEKNRLAVTDMPLDMLADQAGLGGGLADPESYREITRRASPVNKHPDMRAAQKTLMNIIQKKQATRLPGLGR